MIPGGLSQKYLFDGCTINGVYVHPVTAYSNQDLWYDDLINSAIPTMGDKYMHLFINCGFRPFVFLDLAQTYF